ncbi:uncharacterized protein LOC113227443 [Hyposmocoma kahamanoa]|uniref:uncharacterized protein LOC113227443 n=1 Tax=Hyposmocoma kahamanoa TaxID=1477025 RepID=UPI000E6D5AC6|nr:uncharacterized protein LOC113227443 [Hyposmocoma kahamanoa]
MSCLLQMISYEEYLAAESLPLERCQIFAKLANLKIQFTNTTRPGRLLIETLNQLGYNAEQYRNYLATVKNTKIVRTFYQPYSKVAILIANNRYTYLSRLSTPPHDCDSLGSYLKTLGFIVVTVKNTTSNDLKVILNKLFQEIPQNSYCFIFYAGHGCELSNTKFILTIDCPTEDIREEHCVTENFVLNSAAKCKPELCILIMDMCRIHLDRPANPGIFTSILFIPPSIIHKNLLLSYSTQSSQAAYEMIELETSTTIDNEVTYEIKTGDTDRIMPMASQYVNALYTRLEEDLDVSCLLDMVHADVEKSMREQRPIKVQCGTDKRSLYDPATGDIEELFEKLKEVEKIMKESIKYEYFDINVNRPTECTFMVMKF